MIKYTIKDVKILASTIATYFHDGSDTWLEVFEDLKKEYIDDTEEMILDMLGPYLCAFNRKACKKRGVTDMIFELPTIEMPLYINSKKEWEVIIARWRLVIDK